MYSFNYERLKDKSKLAYNNEDDYAVLLETVLSTYDFDGFPDTFNSDFFMNYLLTEAWACIGPGKDGDIVSLHFSPCGSPDSNGLGKDAIVSSDNGMSFTLFNWRDQDKYIPCNLNRIYSPDLTLAKTAAFLGEADTSIFNILKAARYNKAFIAKDEKTKAQLDQCINAVGDGRPYTIVSNNLKDALMGGDGNVQELNLADPDLVTRLQYLCKFEDDTLRDFFNKYGLSTYGSGKMAQLSVEEATAGENRAEVIPDSRLKNLKAWVKRVNAAYGYDCSVNYSKPWKEEHTDEKMVNNEDTTGSDGTDASGGDNDGQPGEDMDTTE